MTNTTSSNAFVQAQETAEVVALAPQPTLTNAGEIIGKHLNRQVDLMPFFSTYPHGLFSWELIKEKFLKACLGAKVVILHDWVQAENPHKGYELAKKIAEEIKAINPQAKIFSPPMGGAWPSPVHSVAKMLFSWSQPELLNALKT